MIENQGQKIRNYPPLGSTLFSHIIWIWKYYWKKIHPNLSLKIKLLQSIDCLQDWEILEICLGSTSWPLLRASNTKWRSIVALSGKRCSEVSHVLGGGPRQRGPCKTPLETWPWDRVLDESALTVPCPVAYAAAAPVQWTISLMGWAYVSRQNTRASAASWPHYCPWTLGLPLEHHMPSLQNHITCSFYLCLHLPFAVCAYVCVCT